MTYAISPQLLTSEVSTVPSSDHPFGLLWSRLGSTDFQWSSGHLIL